MRLKSSFKRAFYSQFGVFFSDKGTALAVFLVLILLSISLSWIPDALSTFLPSGKEGSLVMLAISFLILLGLYFFAVRYASEVEFDVFEASPDRKRVLIVFLSKLNENVLSNIEKIIKDLRNGRELPENFDFNTFKSWRMPYEAVKYHLPKLKKLIVVTSKDSSEQFPLFRELINLIFEAKIEVEERKLENFESVKEIFKEINSIYGGLQKQGIKEKDIIIDVTGGQKTNSIAAAFMTLYYDREFQYVSTQNYEVKSYDVRPVRD